MGKKQISERCEIKNCVVCKNKFIFQDLRYGARENLKFDIGYAEKNEVVNWFSRWLRAVEGTKKRSMCFTCYMNEIYNINSKYIEYGYSYFNVKDNNVDNFHSIKQRIPRQMENICKQLNINSTLKHENWFSVKKVIIDWDLWLENKILDDLNNIDHLIIYVKLISSIDNNFKNLINEIEACNIEKWCQYKVVLIYQDFKVTNFKEYQIKELFKEHGIDIIKLEDIF